MLKKRERNILSVVLVLCFIASLFSACGTKKAVLQKDTMLWMDAYVALAEKESTTIDLHYFYIPENAAFASEDIASIAFKGVEKELIVDEFSLTEKEGHPDDIYHGYSMAITYHFEAQGLFEVDTIIINLAKGGKITYPVGNWVFDVGRKPDSILLDAEGTPGASSNNRELACSYKIESGYTLDQLQTGQYEKYDIGEEGIYQHNLSINALDAPVYFVKPKATVSKGEELSTQYTLGCYCGILDVTQDDIEMSRIHFQTFMKDNK